MDQHNVAGAWRKFFVVTTGKTLGAHEAIVKKLKHKGHQDVNSEDDSDYLLVFCPVVSRPQSDIDDGLSRITADKPVILVVMHHNFDPDHIIAESRRGETTRDVRLIVDVLFFKHKLLKCKLNDNSWANIKTFLHLPDTQESLSFLQRFIIRRESGRKFFVVTTGKTLGAHEAIVKKLKHEGHQDVNSEDDCDYFLVFCPVVSRIQSDIDDGLSRITTDKPVILVVMHHSYDPNCIIAESKRREMNRNVLLAVDVLFYKHALLNCKLNESSWTDIQEFLQLPIEKGKNSELHVDGHIL